MTTATRILTSGRLLARSALWNLVGMAAPMLVALVVIPLLIDGMGKERFGLLAIIWMGVGYFSLFDLGLGRALTKMVSERLGREETDELGPIIWTAFSLLAALGALGAALLLIFSQPLVAGLLNVPAELRDEGIAAFRVLAVGLPLVIVTAGLVGLLEAHQRFGTIAAIRVPLGVLTFAGPLVTLQFTPSIAWATAVLLAGRMIALAIYYLAAARVRVELRSPRILQRAHIRPLLSFGGWLTVTNIVGPLMTYLDRFFIGGLLSLSAVAYYVTPYEVLSRLQILPQAIMGVLFPAMAAAHGSDRKRMTELYATSSKVVYWTILPITTSAFLLAPEALMLWLGEDFRDAATPVVRWLAAGWMLNMLARPAFTVLQSAGRPDLVAKSHLAELIPYLCLLWWLAAAYGIAGAAAAWSLRVVADTIILNAIAARVLPALGPLIARSYIALLVTGAASGGAWLLEPLPLRLLVLLVVTIAAVSVLWPIARRAVRNWSQSGGLNSDRTDRSKLRHGINNG